MERTRLSLHSDFRIGTVDPRLFGGFVEHLGRAIYGGLYDPETDSANSEGWRTDVLDLLRVLDFSVMRYPGGNFASGYHWRDGIGPRSERPARVDKAWNSEEPNWVGTDEFLSLAERMGWQPMLTVNLGLGDPGEAAEWLAYCNAPEETELGSLRSVHGRTEPYGVGLWCLGNEMDGEWQLGHMSAEAYAEKAVETAQTMREVDPDVELVACGSSNPDMDSWLSWDRTVLEATHGLAEYISLHRYAAKHDSDTPEFLAISNDVDRQIEAVDATCRHVQERLGSRRRTYLCFDEWNVWYRTAKKRYSDGRGTFAPHLIEEEYSLEDALVVATFINSFLRHADVVRIANLAQIVNAIAPVLTDGNRTLIQSIYWPFEMTSRRRGGDALQIVTTGPTYGTKAYGPAHMIDSGAILEGDRLSLFLVNRSLREHEVVVSITDRDVARFESGEIVGGPSADAKNTFEQPDLIHPTPFDAYLLSDGRFSAVLAPLSFAAVTLELDA